jgi:hypothetical protein
MHWHTNVEVFDQLGSIGGCNPGVTQPREECPHLSVRGLLGALRVFHSFAPVISGVGHLAPPVVPLAVNIIEVAHTLSVRSATQCLILLVNSGENLLRRSKDAHCTKLGATAVTRRHDNSNPQLFWDSCGQRAVEAVTIPV